MRKRKNKTFGAHKFERVQWSHIKPLKIIRGLGPPIFPLLGFLFCPLHHHRAPKCSIAPSRAQFPIFPIRSFSPPPQFPHFFIKGFQFSHCVTRHQRTPHFLLRHQGPQISSSCHQLMLTSNFPSRYQEVSIYHCVIKGPIVTLNFPLRYQGVPIYHCVIKVPPIPPSRHQRDPNFQIQHLYNLHEIGL